MKFIRKDGGMINERDRMDDDLQGYCDIEIINCNY